MSHSQNLRMKKGDIPAARDLIQRIDSLSITSCVTPWEQTLQVARERLLLEEQERRRARELVPERESQQQPLVLRQHSRRHHIQSSLCCRKSNQC